MAVRVYGADTPTVEIEVTPTSNQSNFVSLALDAEDGVATFYVSTKEPDGELQIALGDLVEMLREVEKVLWPNKK